MATEHKKQIALEIACVLFIHMVGYTKTLIDGQHEQILATLAPHETK